MTTPSTQRKAGPLLGTGVQTSWPFTFKIFAEGDIKITIANSLGIETELVLDTDYSVSLNANQDTSPGGTVTYPISGTPLAIGSVLSIVGDLDYDQPLDLPSGGNFSPLALENELDRLTMQIQQLRETVSRSLLVPVTSAAAPSLPFPEANQLIGWDATGATLQNVPISDLATAVGYGTFRYDTFTGDGSTTEFALTSDPAVVGNLDVAMDGLTMMPGTDYSLASGVLVFSVAPSVGAEVLARYGQGLPITASIDAAAVAYQPAGVGSEVTDVQSKLRESVSVKDFGASPAASGAANVAAFKLAATAIASLGGGDLLVPPGNYTFTGGALGNYLAAIGSSIDFVGASGINIIGYGATLTNTDTNGQVWFRFRSCSNISVRGLTFQGAQVGDGSVTSSGAMLYFDTAASNIVFEDLKASNGGIFIEFQTDDLVSMGGVKYDHVVMRNVQTHGFYHAMELLHINDLQTYGIRMTGTGASNNINFRGIYALNVTNWNGDGIYASGCGNPAVGGMPIFVREYTKGGGSTLLDYNCDTVNLSNISLTSCYAGGMTLNVASGQISNVSLSNLKISSTSTNSYGGGLLEFAHDNASPTGINNVKVSNCQITALSGASTACLLYRNSSNVTSETTAFSVHHYNNLVIDGFTSSPMNFGTGGWVKYLYMDNVRVTTTDNTPYITFNRISDAFFNAFFNFNKTDFSGSKLVRVVFDNSLLNATVATSTDMAPVIINGESLTSSSITVNASTGNDSSVGSAAAPLLTLSEAVTRVSKLNRGKVTNTISMATNANYGALVISDVLNPLNIRAPLGNSLSSVTINNCGLVDFRNGTNCAGGVTVFNSNAFIQSFAFAGSAIGILATNSKVTSSNNNFGGGVGVGIKAVGQSQVWSEVDTGTCTTYGYSLGEASICYKEVNSTLTGSTAQKQTLSVNIANF